MTQTIRESRQSSSLETACLFQQEFCLDLSICLFESKMAPVLDVFNVSIAGASEMIINSVFVLFVYLSCTNNARVRRGMRCLYFFQI